MAEEQVDALVIAARFDDGGLARSVQEQLSQIARFTGAIEQASRTLPPIDVNLDPAKKSLLEGREALERFAAEAHDLKAFPDLSTADARREVDELIAEFSHLDKTLATIDPSGILRVVKEKAREAAESVRAATATMREVAAAPVAPVGVSPRRGDETQQLRLLAAMTEEEERHARQLGATTAATTGLAAAETQLAATMAQQAIASLRAGAAVQVQAEQAARAQDRINQAQRLAQAAAQTPPPQLGGRTLLASRQDTGLVQITEEATRAQAQLAGLRATMLQQGQTARRAAGDNEAAAAALGNIGGQAGRIAEGSAAANAGVSRLRGGLTALAVTASGTNPAIGSVVSGLLLIGAGSAVVLGVAAGVAVIAGAYDLLTRHTREARKATDEFIKAQNEAARQRDPVGKIREAFEGVDESERKVEGLTERMVRLNTELAKAREGRDIQPIGGEGPIEHFVDDTQVAKALQKVKDAATAAKQAGLDFLLPILAAQQAAARQGIADDLAILQQGVTAREQVLQSEYARGLVRTEEYYARRRQLAEQGAGNEVAALQRQLVQAQNVRVEKGDVAGQVARDAEVAHLQSLIRLREQGLGQQLQAIENERKLAQFALEAEQRALRIARAGGGNLTPASGGLGNIPTPSLEPSIFGVRNQGLTVDIPVILRPALARESRDIGKTLAVQLDLAKEKARALASGLVGVGQGLAGIGGAATAATADVLGLVGSLKEVQLANKAVKEATNDTDKAAAQLAQLGATFGLLGQAVSFLGSFIGGITGPNAAEQERDAILRENNQRLDELRGSLDRQLLGAQGVATAAEVAKILAQNPDIRDPQSVGILGRSDVAEQNQKELERQLKAAGLTVEGFARIVKQTTGLDILDKKGRVVADTLAQAAEATKLYIEQITHLGQSTADQRAGLETADKFGIGGRSANEDVARIERQRQLLLDKANLGDAEEARIRALDLNTAAGRAELLRTERELARRALAGQIDITTLGTFTNVDEFLGVLGEGADAIRAFTDAATQASIDIPAGFRQARLAFEAQDPNHGATLPNGPPLRRENFNPRLPGGTDGAQLPAFSTTHVTMTFAEGAVVVPIDSRGKDPDAMAREVLARIKAIGLAESGNPDVFPGGT